MKVGNQPLPPAAQLVTPPSSAKAERPPQGALGTRHADRLEISPEAGRAAAAARAGQTTGLSSAQVRELVAGTNREAARAPGLPTLQELIALLS